MIICYEERCKNEWNSLIADVRVVWLVWCRLRKRLFRCIFTFISVLFTSDGRWICVVRFFLLLLFCCVCYFDWCELFYLWRKFNWQRWWRACYNSRKIEFVRSFISTNQIYCSIQFQYREENAPNNWIIRLSTDKFYRSVLLAYCFFVCVGLLHSNINWSVRQKRQTSFWVCHDSCTQAFKVKRERETWPKMLNRRNSMSLHQPIMPFKWRPFDLYNDIHINRVTNDDNAIGSLVTATATATATTATATATNASRAGTTAAAFAYCAAPNCVQSNCDHLKLLGNFRHRQSSRGSSSGSSSCASLSTASHFVPDVDSTSSIHTAISNGSLEYYRKLLGQCDSNQDDKFPHHQQRTTGSNNGATVNCCCCCSSSTSNYRNITRNRASMNINKPCQNSSCIITVPIQCAETKMHNSCCQQQPQCTQLNRVIVENPLNIHINANASPGISNECHKRGSNSSYFDNWMFVDNNNSSSGAQLSRSLADSKYLSV